MFEINITISTPELAQAIMTLADVMGERPPMVRPEKNEAGLPVIGARVPTYEPEKPKNPEPEAYQKLNEYVQKMQPAAETAQPVPMPMPAPAPVPAVPMPAPEPQPVPAAPMPAPAPAPVQTAPAPATNITLQQIARAGAALVDQGKKAEVLSSLRRFGVQAVTQLKPEQFTQFADELRALGAQI